MFFYKSNPRWSRNGLATGDSEREKSLSGEVFHGDLVDAGLMAAAFEFGGEKLIHDAGGHILVDEAAGHHKHVGIVVLADEMGDLRYPTKTCADGLVLVECHVDALATAADGNAGIYLAALYALGEGMAEVRIVAGGFGISTVVLPRISILVKVFLDELF